MASRPLDAGIVVDLYWRHGELDDEFEVEVEDRHRGVGLVIHATTGRDALEAFYHPFSATSDAVCRTSS